MSYPHFLAVFFILLQVFFGEVFAITSPHRLRIVGSTALYGFSTSVAERFGKLTSYKTPLIEANGTGGGFKIFCQSGPNKGPDAVNASRPIEPEERQYCASQGIQDIQEFKVGYDGIVIAAHNQTIPFNLSLETLFKALSQVVEVDGKWVSNPYKKWSDIDITLPDKKIMILGPPPSSGTYAVLTELILKPLCPKNESKCLFIRTDGVYIQASEHENVIVQKLIRNPEKLGVFSYSFLKQHKDEVQALKINGFLPDIKTIKERIYPLSRLLYVYTNLHKLNEKPELKQFIDTFYDPQAISERGYLTLKGFVPLPHQKN